MQLINTLATKKVAAVGVAAMLAFGLLFTMAAPSAHAALTESQIQSILSLLSSFGADQTTINNVDSSLRGQPTSGSGSSTTGGTGFTFTQNLSQGDTGAEVKELQKFLNTMSDTQVSTSGAGSPGNESSFFGPATKAAVIKFQNKYKADVLTPVGLSAGTGFWGASSRAKANTLNAGSGSSTGTPTTPTTPPVTSGGGLTVSSTSQPANALAPDNASRVPFTNFRITAGSTDVTFKSVTVERVGLGSNTAFSSIMLVNENGVIIGDTKSLNSNNQARIGDTYTVKAGTTMTFTVAGNMPADNSARDGEHLSLNVIGIETSETVNASFPITGATHTVNASLAIGTASMTRGALDPNVNTSKEVGTTGYTFQAVKLTAGSAEDVYIKSIRWDQTGSASETDLENVVVVVDGTSYPTTVGSDGDKYTAVFPGIGLLVKEGLNKEISIKGDIVSGSSRTIDFDIEKATDIHVVGKTFGYGITPTQSDGGSDATTGSSFTAGTPFFSASEVTVSAGTVNIASSNDVPAGNIANGATDVALGSFTFDVRGESVSWASIIFAIATTGANGTAAITNVTLTDANGNVLAGPEDPAANAASVTLSDSVTLAPGVHTLIVRGTLDTNWADSETIAFSLTPNSTNITSLKGDTTGQTITPTPTSAVTAKTQTISAGALAVTPSTSLVSQTVVGNSSNITLGRFVFDATNSGEDVRVTVAKFEATIGANFDVDDLNTLTLYKDGVALNSGSNVVNPSGNAVGADPTITFTLDGTGLTVAKGTSVIIDLKGNISTSTGTAASTIKFDMTSGLADGDWTVTGVQTGTELTEDLDITTAGATITVNSAGTVTASLDSNDPVERWYVPGEEATVAIFDFLTTNESMLLTDLGLVMAQASSSPADLTELSLWNGSTKLLTKVSPAFNGTNNAELFSNLDTAFNFTVPKNEDADLTIKVKFAGIGTNKAGTSGHLIQMGTTTVAAKNKARGVESGTAVNILGSIGTSTGARVFRALPVVAKESTTGSTLSNSTQELYRFSVTAKGDDVALFKFTFNVATSGVTTTGFKVTELETGKIVRSGVNDVDSNGDLNMTVNSTTYGSAVITVPSGSKRTFKLEGTTTGATTGESVTVKLLGDGAFSDQIATGVAGNTTTIDASGHDDFIWSPQSTTTAAIANLDWFNGFRVPGIEFDDLDTHTRSL